MKQVISLIMFLMISFTSYAYDLNITEDDIVKHVQNDWTYVGKSDTFSLYVESGMLDKPKDETIEFHAYIEFNSPEKIFPIQALIKKIYTYGKLNCPAGEMMMISDIYVGVNSKVEFRQYFSPGIQIINMTTPNTLRREAFDLVCGEII